VIVRVAKEWRRHRAKRRDIRRQEDGAALEEVADASPEPVWEAGWNESRERLHARLGPEMWTAFELRLARCAWEEIGRQLGCEPDTVRMRLYRALLKALRDLGIHAIEDLP
jgi:DNA-directed RNA polymerase specialized sigma24 family protein